MEMFKSLWILQPDLHSWDRRDFTLRTDLIQIPLRWTLSLDLLSGVYQWIKGSCWWWWWSGIFPAALVLMVSVSPGVCFMMGSRLGFVGEPWLKLQQCSFHKWTAQQTLHPVVSVMMCWNWSRCQKSSGGIDTSWSISPLCISLMVEWGEHVKKNRM